MAQKQSAQPGLSLTDQLAERLAQRIICGALPAHSRLPESVLAREWGCSRGATREAMRVLERWHLVNWHAGRGARVNSIDARTGLVMLRCLFTVLDEALRDLGDDESRMELAAALRMTASVPEGQFYQRCETLLAFIQHGVECEFMYRQIRDLRPPLQRIYFALLERDHALRGDLRERMNNLADVIAADDFERSREQLRDLGEHIASTLRQQQEFLDGSE